MGNLIAKLMVAGVAASLVACPPPARRGTGGTIVTVEGDPPDFPSDFTPGEPLPDPAPPDPAMFGLAYLERVYPALRDGWAAFLEDARLRLPPDHPLNDPTLEARVEIVVDEQGAVRRVDKLQGSGNDDFDAVAVEVAREAGPFPAPPRELLSDDDHVYLTWLFARDRRQAGIATAQLRRTEWPIAQAVPKFIDDGDLAEASRRVAAAARAAAAVDAKSPEATQLTSLGERVMIAALREGLRADDPAVQRQAVDAITRAAAARGAEALRPTARELRALADGSKEIEVRAAAVAALGVLGDRDAVPLLTAILERDRGANPPLSGAAAGALVALGAGDAAGKLLEGWLAGKDRGQLGGALATLAHAAVPGTTDDVARHVSHRDLGVRIAACRALGTAAGAGHDGSAWKSIGKGLDDRDATVRAACAAAAAAAAATGAKHRGTYWKVVALFKDRDDRVRASAVLAAARLEPARVGQELTLLAREKSPVVLAALAEGLGAAPGTTPPKRLVELAGHTDAAVRAAAVRALAGRKDAASRQVAAKLVVDPELAVRLGAIAAIDDPAQLDALAEDATPEVAAAADARRVLLRGRWAGLAAAATAIAAAPPSSAARVRVAGAWLQSG